MMTHRLLAVHLALMAVALVFHLRWVLVVVAAARALQDAPRGVVGVVVGPRSWADVVRRSRGFFPRVVGSCCVSHAAGSENLGGWVVCGIVASFSGRSRYLMV